MDYIIIYPLLVSRKRKRDENPDGKKTCEMYMHMPTYMHTILPRITAGLI